MRNLARTGSAFELLMSLLLGHKTGRFKSKTFFILLSLPSSAANSVSLLSPAGPDSRPHSPRGGHESGSGRGARRGVGGGARVRAHGRGLGRRHGHPQNLDRQGPPRCPSEGQVALRSPGAAQGGASQVQSNLQLSPVRKSSSCYGS